MSLENIARNTVDRNIVDPAKRIYGAVSREKAFGKPGVLVAETVKEGLFLVPRNAAAIANWTLGKMFILLGGTVKLGLKSAMHIPLPLPVGMNSPAALKGNIDASLEQLRIKLGGRPKKWTWGRTAEVTSPTATFE
ncbi:hypothetical protein EXS65_01705 [Candidatus Peribacteria bacterium]|nr:hypothetical protein [Candidatus Peribacteria bacterium]